MMELCDPEELCYAVSVFTLRQLHRNLQPSLVSDKAISLEALKLQLLEAKKTAKQEKQTTEHVLQAVC